MAGDYFDADQYLRDQEAFRAAVLNSGQTQPLPDNAPSTSEPTAPAEDRASAFRRIMNVGVSAAPNLSAAPGILGTVGTVARDVEQAAPGTLARIAPREQIPNHEQYGPSNIFKRPTSEMTPMYPVYPDIQPAPTLKDQARKAVGAGAGLGGGEGLGGLLGKYRAAQQDQVDTMGHGADLQLDLGQNKADATTQMADLRAAQAMQMQRDAERQAAIEQAAQKQHEDFLARSQQLADQVTSQQIDPARFLHNADSKTQFLIGLGSAIGGANAAANGGPNQYLERLDNIMDRDFKGQLANLDNAHKGLSARNTIFGQVMAETQDRRLADMQARDLMYTAMKTKLLSDADRLGVPEIMTQAKIAANEIENKQKGLQAQILGQSYQSALSQQAAARAAQERQEARAYQMGQDVIKNNQEQQKIDIAASAAGKSANKEQDAVNTELHAYQSEIGDMRRNIQSATAGTSLGNLYSKAAPAFAPGATTAKKNAAARDDYNTRVKMMIGGIYKLGTDSTEPKRKELIDEYSKAYVLKTDDNDEVALHKLQQLEHLAIVKSAAKGASPGPLAPGFVPDTTVGAK